MWSRICTGLDVPAAEITAAREALTGVLGSWADDPIGATCAVPSYVSADGFPAEFSLSWKHDRPEIRVLFESLGRNARESQRAGSDLTRRLADERGVSVERYLKIEDLFLTEDPKPYRPAVWHSLAWEPGGRPQYKVYLNPQAHGRHRSFEVVADAMDRLGMGVGWHRVAARADELQDNGHELEFFALDLGATRSARVKVYFRHGPVSRSGLGEVAAMARSHDEQRAARIIRTIYGPETTEFHNEPMTCLAFREGADEPEEANLYLRLPENARNDEEAAARIACAMRSEGLDPTPYLTTLRSLCPQPLNRTAGLQELFSYRTVSKTTRPHIGVYLRPSPYPTKAQPPK
ncbi:tryptophan dimethylallyltransferase family protein [Saccharopolyspora taberi]|uniref:Tryptophan dimethylallyltransferase n=1 Tax=Saccharopolyspora taberi TaxID=60895 RepID=A0ABN3VGT4_9PSEU